MKNNDSTTSGGRGNEIMRVMQLIVGVPPVCPTCGQKTEKEVKP